MQTAGPADQGGEPDLHEDAGQLPGFLVPLAVPAPGLRLLAGDRPHQEGGGQRVDAGDAGGHGAFAGADGPEDGAGELGSPQEGVGRPLVEVDHPLLGGVPGGDLGEAGQEPFGLLGHRRDQDLFLGGEALVDGPERHLGPGGHLAQAHRGVAVPLRQFDGGVDDPSCAVVHERRFPITDRRDPPQRPARPRDPTVGGRVDPVRLFLGHVAARAGGSRLRWPPVVRFVPPLLVLAVFGAATTARANPEPPYAYDARVAGMGGAASAVTENATGLFHNPAQLDAIERFSVTAVITSLLVNLRAPFAGPGSEQDSGIQYAPLLFVGGVGRVHERVTLGLGAYVYTGFGGGYRTVDCIAYDDPTVCDDPDYPGRLEPAQSQEVALFIAEAALPVQVTVTKWLSVGVTLRMPWGRQTVTATQETTNGNENTLFFGRATQQISGFGIPGVLLGVSVRPPQVEGLTLALAYRSKVWVDMEGTTEAQLGLIGGEPRTLEVPTTTRWYVPHMVRVGVAYRTWHDRLTISGPEAMVSPEAYTVLALVMHEMITNSAKYGPLSDQTGTLEIDVSRDDDAGLCVDWRERGGPPVKPPQRRGFGSTIIERSIPFELQGKSDISFHEDGFQALLTIPPQHITRTKVKELDNNHSPEITAPVISEESDKLLSGNVLLVEDTMLLALGAERHLMKLGAARVFIASNISNAKHLLNQEEIEFCLLDVNLEGEISSDVAWALHEKGIPFGLATGYGAVDSLLDQFPPTRLITKPYDLGDIASLIMAIRDEDSD